MVCTGHKCSCEFSVGKIEATNIALLMRAWHSPHKHMYLYIALLVVPESICGRPSGSCLMVTTNMNLIVSNWNNVV